MGNYSGGAHPQAPRQQRALWVLAGGLRYLLALQMGVRPQWPRNPIRGHPPVLGGLA